MTNHAQPTTPVVVLDEFLVAEEWRGLVDFTLRRTPEFVSTHVIGAGGANQLDYQTRRSVVLFDVGPFAQVFAERLTTFLPHVLTRLRHEGFPVSHIEIQLTGTGNGEFFRRHTDNGSAEVASREITFVYFFHREPRPFSGGELRIYDTVRENGASVASGPHRVIYPMQNQVVFFPSGCLHEILPVGCPTGEFADRRFTINGWFHR
jgi:Rps23 Pro-64 3,4-dihydroxylase Tpa1-like proline 4-hydroxylase